MQRDLAGFEHDIARLPEIDLVVVDHLRKGVIITVFEVVLLEKLTTTMSESPVPTTRSLSELKKFPAAAVPPSTTKLCIVTPPVSCTR